MVLGLNGITLMILKHSTTVAVRRVWINMIHHVAHLIVSVRMDIMKMNLIVTTSNIKQVPTGIVIK